MNSVNITGRLTGDYEVKYMASGKGIGNFSIAVNDGWGDNKHTSFFEVAVFGKSVEHHKKFIGKGSHIAISGILRQERWEGQDSTKRSKIKIIANSIEYLDNKPKKDDGDVPF